MTATTTAQMPPLRAVLSARNVTTMARIALSLLALASAACDQPCGLKLVQVDATRDVARIHNTCPGEIDVSGIRVCVGESYGEHCAAMPEPTMSAGECVEVGVPLPHSSKTAFGVGVFGAGEEPDLNPPLSNFVFGVENTSLLDDDGSIRQPMSPSVPIDKAATWGRYRWWYAVPSAAPPVACATWEHRIVVEDVHTCEPMLVEVHPGRGTSFVKLSLQPGCKAVNLGEYVLALGQSMPSIKVQLPPAVLQSGQQVVVGDGVEAASNGWPKWTWSGMFPVTGWPSAGLLDQTGGIVMLKKADETISAVSWGSTTAKGVFNIDEVPPGRSMLWKGDQWHLGVASPNQIPRWLVLDAE